MGRTLLICLGFLAGCGASAPPPPSDDAHYAAAERALSAGDLATAQRLFEALAAASSDPEQAALYRYRLATVARRGGQDADAQRILAEVAEGGSAERAPLAAYLQAVAVAEAGQGDAALRALVEAQPDTIAADKAVKYLGTHPATPVAAADSAAWLEGIAARHPEAAVADNALWWASELRLLHLGDIPAARDLLRRLATHFPESPLTDDAIWRLSQLHRRQGAWAEAVETLGALLEIRNESSYLVGSYRSPYLDDAALAIARIRYHALHDAAGAALAYRALVAEFPQSVLCDDALFELAGAELAMQRPAAAQATLKHLLRAHPDSRHVEAARALLAAAHPAPPPMDAARVAPDPFVPVTP